MGVPFSGDILFIGIGNLLKLQLIHCHMTKYNCYTATCQTIAATLTHVKLL